ncbi:MAG: acetate--CoA ligase family protein [Thermodesulfobacteriota bacterium]
MSIHSIFERVRGEHRVALMETESKAILKEAGLPVIDCWEVHSAPKAVQLSKSIGFPVALKILSPKVIHKSERGGVKLNLCTGEAVRKAYHDIKKAFEKIDPDAGVSVQKMVDGGVETIAGMVHDPQFGPVIMFGLGGIFVELLTDISFRLIPIERGDAHQMIREIKGYPLLQGFRGKPGVNIGKLEELMMGISSLAIKYPEISEMDLNPILAYPDRVLIADARILLKERDGHV